jgi:hypothetical protein
LPTTRELTRYSMPPGNTWRPVFAVASVVQFCRPIQHDGQGHRLGLLYWRDDQKSLAVSADVINKQVIDWDWLSGSGLKKCHRRAGIEIGTGCHRNGHHPTIRRKVEQFPSITTPTWLFATSNRDLPLAAWYRKGCHVNFPFPGFIRGVGDPFSVGGELAVPEDRRRLQEEAGLFNDQELIPKKGLLTVLLPQPEVDYIALMEDDLYMFPRTDGILLGGTFEDGEWSLSVNEAAKDRVLNGHAQFFQGFRRCQRASWARLYRNWVLQGV